MCEESLKKYNFIDFIDKNNIVIPLIQRDYAQGRKSEESKANKFLDYIIKGIKGDKKLNLDFIYGTFRKNDKGNKTKDFLPLDGQQRLSTLFLIYFYSVYLSVKDETGSIEEVTEKKLGNFTYELRGSSEDFIKGLTDKDNIFKLTNKDNIIKLTKEDDEGLLVKMIKNSSWFFKAWEKDPSVKAMLNMLTLIESNEDFKDLKPDDLKNITFDFLNLKNFNLSDELYVKMNARGKPLSDFENFKAEFELQLNSLEAENAGRVKDIKRNLDGSWLDMFWNKSELNPKETNESEPNPKETDEKYFNFFSNITLFFYLNNDIKENDENKSFDKKFNNFDIFQYKYKKDDIRNIEKILDFFENSVQKESDTEEVKKIRDKKMDIFEDFLKSGEKITYVERVLFYALMQFILKMDNLGEDNEDIFGAWMRISTNLIQNTIVDSISIFVRIKNAIDVLSDFLDKNASKFYEKISEENEKIKFEQFKEEQIKAKLIYEDYQNRDKEKKWEKAIIKAEKYWYLEGQIGFLLEYSKNDSKEPEYDKFNSYLEAFKKLFDKDKINPSNEDGEEIKYATLIHRALLTIDDDDIIEKTKTTIVTKWNDKNKVKHAYTKGQEGDLKKSLKKLGYLYLTRHGNQKYTFCDYSTRLRTKDENWRKVFGSYFFQKLLDKLDNKEKVEDLLLNLVNNYVWKEKDFKSYFINPNKKWEIISGAQYFQIEIKGDSSIRLCQGGRDVTTWAWSRALELRSYYYFKYITKLKGAIKDSKDDWFYHFEESECDFAEFWYHKSEKDSYWVLRKIKGLEPNKEFKIVCEKDFDKENLECSLYIKAEVPEAIEWVKKNNQNDKWKETNQEDGSSEIYRKKLEKFSDGNISECEEVLKEIEDIFKV